MKHFDICRCIAGALLATAALFTPTGVQAQQGPKPRLNPAMVAKNPYSKLVRDLVKLEQAYKTYESQPNARKGPFTPPNRLFQIREGKYVLVDAVAENGAPALKNDLTALGAKGIVSYGRVVSCLVPLNRISQLQNLRSMRFARPAYAANNVGLVTSGGDSAQRSGLARRQFGLNGKGIKVGALSDSYNQLIGERGSVITGDLPGPENPNGYKKPVQVLEDIEPFEQATSDEGRAMLEIIHDVVPGAELAFHTAFQGQAGFANGIIALKDSGCNVIVDDVFYYAEPYFQEGIIAQAVNQVAKEGVAYFSSAGNQARDSYQKAFQPSGRNFLGGEAHNFAPGDPFLRFFVPAGGEAIIILQWSDPFFSVSGKGAGTDLNLYLVNDSLNQVLFASDFPNLGEDPFEGFVVTNDGPGTYYNLLIENAGGPDPELIKVIGYNSFTPVEHWTYSSTVVGHPNAAGAIAVGAARYDQTPAFGRDTTRLEPFSSAGGTPILFDENGNKISAVVRRKPEITGPDGVNTTFFIPRIDLEGDGFPNFFGTSASAPHAAAVAALMLEANKSLQPGQVRGVLQATALDMDDPYTKGTFDEGFDFGTGYGLIRADRAVESVLGTPLVQRFVLVNADNGEDLDELREGDVINLATLPTRNLNIRAETAPAGVGSVVFDFNGKKATENLAPYALAGDFASTPVKYRILTPALSPGNYELSAVPYADDNGEGDAGLALTVNFRVVESAVTGFVLVDADTGEEVMQIEDQSVIYLADLPERVNIRANTVPAKVGSVVFEYNEYLSQYPGLRVVENLPPYALGGDFYEQPARYRALADTLVDEGIYSLLATPYAKDGGKGAAGQPLRVLFLLSADTTFSATRPATDVAVSNAPKPANAQPVAAAGEAAARALGVYPNPTTGKLRVQTAKGGTVALYNAKGDRVYRAKAVDASAQVDLSALPDGLYLLRVEEESAIRTIRVVKRGQ
jgi:hypothetical protein